jgi:regulator of replication initiation timing
MENGNKKFIYNPLVILSVVIFIVGFGLGFYIWGYHKNEKKDYTAILKDAASYVEGMERLNGSLSKEVEALKKDNAMLKSPSNAQVSELQTRVQELVRENATLKSASEQTQYLVQENARLNSELQLLKLKTDGTGTIPQAAPGSTQATTPGQPARQQQVK